MLNNWLSKNEDEIIELRHWLHAHPEVGFNEFEKGFKWSQKSDK